MRAERSTFEETRQLMPCLLARRLTQLSPEQARSPLNPRASLWVEDRQQPSRMDYLHRSLSALARMPHRLPLQRMDICTATSAFNFAVVGGRRRRELRELGSGLCSGR